MEKDCYAKEYLLHAMKDISRACELLFGMSPDLDSHPLMLSPTVYPPLVQVPRNMTDNEAIAWSMQRYGRAPAPPHLDKLIAEKTTPRAAYPKEDKKMPPKYKDGSFSTRKNGLLKYRFKHGDAWVYVYGRTQQDCWDKRTAIISGKKSTKATSTYTLSEWLKKWYATYKVRKDGSSVNSQWVSQVKLIEKLPIGKILINKLTGIHIQEFLKTYDDRTNMRGKLYIFINAALQKAEDNDLIKKNPCRAVEIERHVQQRYPVIQPADQTRILNAIDDPAQLAFFWYLMCSGLRISEAIDSAKHTDFENGIINVKMKDTSTKKHVRQIPFLPELFTVEQRAYIRNMTRDIARNYLYALFETLKIDVVIHSTRHTFASCCYHVGFKDKQIQKWMGHSSLKMTTDTYVDLLEGDDSPIIDYFRRLKERLGL